MKWTAEKLQDAMDLIAKRADNDPAFRELALNQPDWAFQMVTGEPLPRNVKISFFEEDCAI